MQPETKEKLIKKLIKINEFLDDTSIIWVSAFLVIYWVLIPGIQWFYLIALLAIILFAIMFTPLVVLILIIAPLLWISEKIKGEKTCDQTE